MTHLFEKLINVEVEPEVRSRSNVVSNSSLAIERSKELLKEAEEALARSYAVVELSKRFVDSINENKIKEDWANPDWD